MGTWMKDAKVGVCPGEGAQRRLSAGWSDHIWVGKRRLPAEAGRRPAEQGRGREDFSQIAWGSNHSPEHKDRGERAAGTGRGQLRAEAGGEAGMGLDFRSLVVGGS